MGGRFSSGAGRPMHPGLDERTDTSPNYLMHVSAPRT